MRHDNTFALALWFIGTTGLGCHYLQCRQTHEHTRRTDMDVPHPSRTPSESAQPQLLPATVARGHTSCALGEANACCARGVPAPRAKTPAVAETIPSLDVTHHTHRIQLHSMPTCSTPFEPLTRGSCYWRIHAMTCALCQPTDVVDGAITDKSRSMNCWGLACAFKSSEVCLSVCGCWCECDSTFEACLVYE